jgi:hypothetical protein
MQGFVILNVLKVIMVSVPSAGGNALQDLKILVYHVKNPSMAEVSGKFPRVALKVKSMMVDFVIQNVEKIIKVLVPFVGENAHLNTPILEHFVKNQRHTEEEPGLFRKQSVNDLTHMVPKQMAVKSLAFSGTPVVTQIIIQ